MTVKELFPLVIKNYEDCIEAIKPLYNRDNWWKRIEEAKCDRGICYHLMCIDTEFKIHSSYVKKVLELQYAWLCDFPRWNRTKEENIELLEIRISAMKKALDLYPDEEI